MLIISLIFTTTLLGFKLLNSIYINRINILVSFYSGCLTLIILIDSLQSFSAFGLGLYNSLGFTTTVVIFGQFFIWISTFLLLLLGESNRNTKNILRSSEYTIILLISVLGMNFLLISNDIITIILSIELISFPSAIISSLYKNGEDYYGLGFNRFNLSGIFSGLKYLLLGSLASCFIIFGFAIIYGETGLTNISKIIELLSIIDSWETIHELKTKLGFTLIIVGFLIKIGAGPFHNWAPDVYDGVPTIVTSWISIIPKIAFLIYFSILLKTQINSLSNIYGLLILLSSFFSLLIGSIFGLRVFRIKRLLAYSSISHLGFILLGIACIGYTCYTPILFYIIVYTITSINIFLIIACLNLRSNVQLLSQLKGLANHSKLLAFSLVISFFSLAGIPPFIGFYSKALILIESVNLGYNFITLIGLIASIISTVYYLRIIKIINFDIDNSKTAYNISINETIASAIAFITLIIFSFIFNGDLLILILNTSLSI